MFLMLEENNFDRREALSDTPAPTPVPEQRGSSQYYYVGQSAPYRPSAPQYPESKPTPPVQDGADKLGARTEKQKIGIGKLVAIFAVCVILAALVGGACGYFVADRKAANSKVDSQSAGGSNVVIYESDDNGSSSPTLSSNATIADIAAKVSPSVVEITTEVVQYGSFMQQYIATGAGSGVILSADGYIVTNHHVIDGARSITVILSDGKIYPATLVGTDDATDVAVIKIEASGLTPAVLGKSGDLKVGDFALAVGNPLGKLGGTVTDGIISALERQVLLEGFTMTLLQTNAAVNPGNSGGGLFNASGELIGIVNSGIKGDIEGIGFAIPIDTAKPVIEDLLEYGYVTGRAYMGIQMLDVLDYITAIQYRVSELGPYIYIVEENSDAQRAGLRSGDLILKVNGTAVADSTDVRAALLNYNPGDTITITILRDGRQHDVEVTFTEYNPESGLN